MCPVQIYLLKYSQCLEIFDTDCAGPSTCILWSLVHRTNWFSGEGQHPSGPCLGSSYLLHKRYHRWFFLSNQKINETSIFVTWDSEDNGSRPGLCSVLKLLLNLTYGDGSDCPPHSAFKNTSAPLGCAPRQSVESRFIVVARHVWEVAISQNEDLFVLKYASSFVCYLYYYARAAWSTISQWDEGLTVRGFLCKHSSATEGTE